MRAFCDQVNTRVHRVTRRAPADMLAEEQRRLHPLPAAPHTVALGVTRTVAANTPLVTFEGGQYSVPRPLLGQVVWVRIHGQGAGEQVVIVHVGDAGPVEWPGTPAPLRAARSWPTGTSRRPRPARWTGSRSRRPPRRRSSWPSATAPGCG